MAVVTKEDLGPISSKESPSRQRLQVTTDEGDAEAVVKEKQEKALAEHVACHPEDAGRTVKDFEWTVWRIVTHPWEPSTMDDYDQILRDRITYLEQKGRHDEVSFIEALIDKCKDSK